MLTFVVSGEASYFEVGQTVCGRTYKNTDYVAAISDYYFADQLDDVCGREVQVIDPNSGLDVTVTIVDVCRHCSRGDIALTISAFERFRSLSAGTIGVEWQFL